MLKAADHAQRRRLAAAGRAEQRQEFAVPHIERDPVHRGRLPEVLVELAELDAELVGQQAAAAGSCSRRCRDHTVAPTWLVT